MLKKPMRNTEIMRRLLFIQNKMKNRLSIENIAHSELADCMKNAIIDIQYIIDEM